VRANIPVPNLVNVPVPEITPEQVWLEVLLKTKAALLAIFVFAIAPVDPPFPIESVPALIVVIPV
jgi:hypothetical protein